MASQKSPALGFIFVTILIDVIGLGIIIPVMPQLISELTGDTIGNAARESGWILFAYAFTQFLCAPISVW
jgi:DHA1 family tetracycline resistance protein-like MFS transporter